MDTPRSSTSLVEDLASSPVSASPLCIVECDPGKCEVGRVGEG